jgi:hypothetical protein
MKKKIKKALINLKDALDQNISPHKQKIIGAAATVPIVAISTMSGACAAGCPYGLVNDPFPGQCPRYIDVNGDGICDLSQAAAATTASTSTTASSTDTTTPSSGHSSSASSDTGGQDIQNGSPDPSDINNTTVDPSSGGLDSSNATAGNDFHILPVSLLIIGAYLFTHYLFSKGILKPKTHKRLWNLLLMGGYMGTGITGVILIYMVNLGVSLVYRQGLTYWHVELALLMVIGTLIHFHIYRKPFKNMFKVLFGSPLNKMKSNKAPKYRSPGTSK